MVYFCLLTAQEKRGGKKNQWFCSQRQVNWRLHRSFQQARKTILISSTCQLELRVAPRSWFGKALQQVLNQPHLKFDFSIFVTPVSKQQKRTQPHITQYPAKHVLFSSHGLSDIFDAIRHRHIPKQPTGACMLRASQRSSSLQPVPSPYVAGSEDQELPLRAALLLSAPSSTVLLLLNSFGIFFPCKVFFHCCWASHQHTTSIHFLFSLLNYF